MAKSTTKRGRDHSGLLQGRMPPLEWKELDSEVQEALIREARRGLRGAAATRAAEALVATLAQDLTDPTSFAAHVVSRAGGRDIVIVDASPEPYFALRFAALGRLGPVVFCGAGSEHARAVRNIAACLGLTIPRTFDLVGNGSDDPFEVEDDDEPELGDHGARTPEAPMFVWHPPAELEHWTRPVMRGEGIELLLDLVESGNRCAASYPGILLMYVREPVARRLLSWEIEDLPPDPEDDPDDEEAPPVFTDLLHSVRADPLVDGVAVELDVSAWGDLR